MKYDGVIILNAIGNLGIFAAGAAMMVKAWIIFVISLIIFLGATMAHAWYLANLRQQVKKEVEKEEGRSIHRREQTESSADGQGRRRGSGL